MTIKSILELMWGLTDKGFVGIFDAKTNKLLRYVTKESIFDAATGTKTYFKHYGKISLIQQAAQYYPTHAYFLNANYRESIFLNDPPDQNQVQLLDFLRTQQHQDKIFSK